MELIVDIQGFKQPHNAFVLKEFAAINVQNNETHCFVFKPPNTWNHLPAKYKSINLWLIRNWHGLSWECGDVSYNDIKLIISNVLESACYIYVKGDEKKKWLDEITDNSKVIIDLYSMDSPGIRTIKNQITSHPGIHYAIRNCHCALDNVQQLKLWFQNYWGEKSSLNKSIQLYYALKNLSKLRKEDIEILPENFILSYASESMDEIWDKLPENLKNNHKFIEERRCKEHFNFLGLYTDAFDGPLPKKKNCIPCQNNKKKII
ncbi:uncharacterized protein LOC122852021 [Aphidius gifuensis]|uniref:uncharacterized protein LOC122852021 n=1 Tax=Aphidius gifuensis TaxID=684658 RepID=UPI001CDD0E03|nr:uncharacterized protein LOC122852021 [Aphidius gifuensis]